MVTDSNLLAKLNHGTHVPHGEPIHIYGDPTFLPRVHLQGPYQNNTAGLTAN